MHTPYQQQLGRLPDFEVTYRLYTIEEGGRYKLPFQGIRWDFCYADNPTSMYMIWPEFININGDVFTEEGVPMTAHGKANMWIVNKALRPYHRQHLSLGTRGYFQEGGHRVGVCEVIRLISLLELPINPDDATFSKTS